MFEQNKHKIIPIILLAGCVFLIFTVPVLVGVKDTIIFWGGLIAAAVEPIIAAYMVMKLSLPKERIADRSVAFIGVVAVIFAILTMLLAMPVINALPVYSIHPLDLINRADQPLQAVCAGVAGFITALIVSIRWSNRLPEKK
jgi:MFS-type transporter involved in bile tolerance (Atg22 family)